LWPRREQTERSDFFVPLIKVGMNKEGLKRRAGYLTKSGRANILSAQGAAGRKFRIDQC
jgi:hypothetical protein